jgi:small GTP-binding protein
MSLREHKIIFIGDSHSGKTTIIYKYLNLTQTTFPTVAASSFPIPVSVRDVTVRLDCWDTAGQENYRCLIPIYARGAEVACLVFDQANIASFESLDHWLKYLQADVGVARVIIACNKCDLDPVVSPDLAAEFCASRRVPLIVTSATLGTNIALLFHRIAELVLEDTRRVSPSDTVEIAPDARRPCC